MLTQSQIDNLKHGDKVRLCGFAGKSYEHYNGKVVEVVDPHFIIPVTFRETYCIKFTPSIQQGENQSECNLVNHNNVELVEEFTSNICVCDIMTIMRVGCLCGGI